MTNLRERAIGAIQRDRLADFFQVASIHDTGCFYFALLMSWNYLYPNRVIDRSFAGFISRGKDRLIVSPREVIDEVKSLEGNLSLKVSSVGITQYLEETPDEFRDNVRIPLGIGVARVSYPIISSSQNNSTIILWLSEGRSHYTSQHPNHRFSAEETAPYHPEYAPATVFNLERTVQ